MTESWASRPCLRAFFETRALPSGVRGPVDFFAFSRFAWIWASVAMTITSFWAGCPVIEYGGVVKVAGVGWAKLFGMKG